MLSGDPRYITRRFTLTSSAITTSPQTLCTVTGDGVILDSVYLKTDSTGLAGGTNFQLKVTTPSSTAVAVAETVANLGASVIVSTPSVTNIKSDIVGGGSITYLSTVGACTGAGKLYITLVFRKVGANSDCQ